MSNVFFKMIIYYIHSLKVDYLVRFVHVKRKKMAFFSGRNPNPNWDFFKAFSFLKKKTRNLNWIFFKVTSKTNDSSLKNVAYVCLPPETIGREQKQNLRYPFQHQEFFAHFQLDSLQNTIF